MDKKIGLIIISIILGAGATIIIYEFYLQNYDSHLNEVHFQLERSSESAFNDLEATASRFVQIHNGLIIHGAMKAGLIDESERNRLAAIFMTRACINYEDENNTELAKKMCLIASQDLSLWNKEIDFQKFKTDLHMKRNKVHQSRDSNQSLKRGTAQSAAP